MPAWIGIDSFFERVESEQRVGSVALEYGGGEYVVESKPVKRCAACGKLGAWQGRQAKCGTCRTIK